MKDKQIFLIAFCGIMVVLLVIFMIISETSPSDLILVTITLIGLPVIVWQLRESAKANRLQALIFIFRDLTSNTSREHRKFVMLELKERSWNDLDDDKDKLCSVWASFDQIAYLIKQGYIPKKIVLDMWGYAIKACYRASKNQLEEAKKDRVKNLAGKDLLTKNEAEKYMKYFKELAEELDC